MSCGLVLVKRFCSERGCKKKSLCQSANDALTFEVLSTNLESCELASI